MMNARRATPDELLAHIIKFVDSLHAHAGSCELRSSVFHHLLVSRCCHRHRRPDQPGFFSCVSIVSWLDSRARCPGWPRRIVIGRRAPKQALHRMAPRGADWEFGSRGRTAIGELIVFKGHDQSLAYPRLLDCSSVCRRIDCLSFRSLLPFRDTPRHSAIQDHYKFRFFRPSGAVHLEQLWQAFRSKTPSLRRGVPGRSPAGHHYCRSTGSSARFPSDD